MEHPITPPPELLLEWSNTWFQAKVKHVNLPEFVATQAARWGADQELQACCDWPETPADFAYRLQKHRRPKPPTLKEQALAALKRQSTRSVPSLVAIQDCDTIRRALEALSDD